MNLQDCVAFCANLGFVVNRTWVCRLWQRLDYTERVPSYKQANKFTVKNLQCYVDFCLGILEIPQVKIKYCDESHFKSKDLRRARARGPRGSRTMIQSTVSLSESYTFTVVTSLVGAPLYVSEARVGSNTGLDFLYFVVDLLRDDVLVAGDVFIIDNASIHSSMDVFELMFTLLQNNGVRLYFLPKYSPELNPCELVFAQAKRHLREHRGNLSFLEEVHLAFALVSPQNVANYYYECLSLSVT